MYRLGERLGIGATAEVFEAWDDALERHVAIKVMLPQHLRRQDFVESFRREGRRLARVREEHVLLVHASTEIDGRPALVVEQASGTLSDRLAGGPLSVEELETLALHLLSGLEALANAGLHHGDIKPSNVLRIEDRWVLGDLGSLEIMLGTPKYAPAELALGRSVADGRTDCYSLGVLLHECALGRAAFETLAAARMPARLRRQADRDGVNWIAWHQAGCELPPPALEGAPALARFIGRLHAGDPALRPQGAREARRDLQEALRCIGSESAPSRRSRLLFALGAAAIGLAVSTGLLLQQRHGAEGPPAGAESAPGVGHAEASPPSAIGTAERTIERAGPAPLGSLLDELDAQPVQGTATSGDFDLRGLGDAVEMRFPQRCFVIGARLAEGPAVDVRLPNALGGWCEAGTACRVDLPALTARRSGERVLLFVSDAAFGWDGLPREPWTASAVGGAARHLLLRLRENTGPRGRVLVLAP